MAKNTRRADLNREAEIRAVTRLRLLDAISSNVGLAIRYGSIVLIGRYIYYGVVVLSGKPLFLFVFWRMRLSVLPFPGRSQRPASDMGWFKGSYGDGPSDNREDASGSWRSASTQIGSPAV
jgi:hypothetical protein